MLRRAIAIPLVLLTFGGAAAMAIGYARFNWRVHVWARDLEQTAEGLCRPGESFSVTRRIRVGSPRVDYNFYCVDARGNRRSLSDDLDAASPLRQPGLWAPLLGGTVCFVGGLLLTGLALRRSGRVAPGPRGRRG